MTYDSKYVRANAERLRAEDDAAWRDFHTCHRLTDVEKERAMAWVSAMRPERITPLYPVPAPQRIAVTARRDVDDEPWGDPVGLGMPRRRARPLVRLLVHALTWKFRKALT